MFEEINIELSNKINLINKNEINQNYLQCLIEEKINIIEKLEIKISDKNLENINADLNTKLK